MISKMKKWFNLETYIVAAVIFAAIFFAKFPTLYHWLNTPAGYWYPKQTSWFDAWDINTYVSYIRYGERNGLLLTNPYTTLSHPKEFIFQFYTSLGVLNKYIHLDPFVLFHIASIISTVILILVTYRVIKIFIDDRNYRMAAFVITILGGGLGWLLYMSSADLSTAGFTMINAFERGHDALSTVFILVSLTSIYLYTISRKTKYFLAGILSTLGSISIHPPMIVLYLSVAVITSLFFAKGREKLKGLWYPFFLLIIFLLSYNLFLARLIANPGFSGVGTVTAGYDLSRISSFSLTFGFGFLAPFLFWALIFVNSTDKKYIFVKFFFLAQIFFCFFPFKYNLYFTKGLYIWGVILAFYGIDKLIANKKIKTVIITVLVFVSLITRINIFNRLMNANVNNNFFYLTEPEGNALSFMSTLPQDSAVLSLYRIGNYIPAHTDNKVYYGHKYVTPDGAETLRRAQIFYTQMNEGEQRKFLKENHIDYIYYGLEEAQLRVNNKLKPQNPFFYFPVLFSNDSSIVYKVDYQELQTKK